VNYRHAFHAGNFADCMKHALLVSLLRALARKPAAFRMLDTHAGIGRYDLLRGEAQRTGEWREGIARLSAAAPPALADYLALVGTDGTYPGSPMLAARLLRAQDRLSLVELHEADHATLHALFRRDPRVQVHRRDGWEAARALTPFAEKRGLVLMDPPFEQPGEFERMTAAMAHIARHARGLIQAAWYPIKGRAPARAFHAALREAGLRDVLACELHRREALDASRLNGCGLVVVNPPFGFEEAARPILAALHGALATGEGGGGWTLERLADE
jgi:23S rRNA (adenine2030-N6)-methyltransferase